MECPEGLNSGTGLPPPRHLALCQIRSTLTKTDTNGMEIILPGTGMLFFTRGGSDYVVTAGHNLFSHRHGCGTKKAEIWFGRNGGTFASKTTMRRHWVCEEFFGNDDPSPHFDFAVIRVDKVSNDETRLIPLHVSDAQLAPEILLSGYPVEGACAGTNQPRHGISTLISVGERNFNYTDLATYKGMSGGPLLRVVDKVLVSLGHHIRGAEHAERGLRYDEFVRQRIYQDWLRE